MSTVGAGSRCVSPANASCASSRASGAPRQTWMPWANATCGFGSRAMSSSSGFAKIAGSRFAAESATSTLSPARIVRLPISTSSFAQRTVAFTDPS